VSPRDYENRENESSERGTGAHPLPGDVHFSWGADEDPSFEQDTGDQFSPIEGLIMGMLPLISLDLVS
jgi:hypothetical protein